jgi:hypothetical protein
VFFVRHLGPNIFRAIERIGLKTSMLDDALVTFNLMRRCCRLFPPTPQAKAHFMDGGCRKMRFGPRVPRKTSTDI